MTRVDVHRRVIEATRARVLTPPPPPLPQPQRPPRARVGDDGVDEREAGVRAEKLGTRKKHLHIFFDM